MPITLRNTKGSKLTHAELDGNFEQLAQDIANINATKIISGAGAPAPSLGSNGNYYLDSTNKILYGPKDGTWGTGTPLGVGDLVQTNTLFVSTTGSDTTGARHLANKPFATFAAAITAASSGDTIVVLPGNYTAQGHIVVSTAKTIYVDCYQGVTLRGIKASGGGKVFLTGQPEFTSSSNVSTDSDGSDNNGIFLSKGSTSCIEADCGNITSTGTAYLGSVDSGSTLKIKAKVINQSGAASWGFRNRSFTTHTILEVIFDKFITSNSNAFWMTTSNGQTNAKGLVRVSGNKLVSTGMCYFNSFGGNNTISEQVYHINVRFSQSLTSFVGNNGANNTDTTNRFQYINFVNCVLVSELNHTLVAGDSVNSGRYMGGYNIFSSVVSCRHSSSAAIFMANNAANNGFVRVMHCLILSAGTFTVNAQNVSAATFYNVDSQFQKTTNNVTITGPAITAQAGLVEYPLEIPTY